MTTHATTQTPYRTNFTAKLGPVKMRVSRVSRAPGRRVPWSAVAVVLVLASGVASGIAVFSVPKLGGRPGKTPLAVKSLHAVAEAWRANHEGECPTVQRLIDEKELSRSADVRDAWGDPYVIACHGDETLILRGEER